MIGTVCIVDLIENFGQPKIMLIDILWVRNRPQRCKPKRARECQREGIERSVSFALLYHRFPFSFFDRLRKNQGILQLCTPT